MNWPYIRHLIWQCWEVLLVVITLACIAGMLGDGPTP